MTSPTSGHPAVAVLLGALAAAIFFSTALVNILAALVSIVAIVHWFRWRPLGLLRHPISIACLAFAAWVVLRELAAGQGARSFKALDEIRPLLFVVLWAPLFRPLAHRRAVVAVCCAGLLAFSLLALGSLAATGKAFYPHYIHPTALALPVVLDKVYTAMLQRAPDLNGPIMVAAIFGALQLAWDGARHRKFWWALAAVLTCALLFAGARRTSQLCFLFCAVLFVIVNARRIDVRAGAAMAVAAVLTGGLLFTSPTVGKGVRQIVADVKEFRATAPEKRHQLWTSGGERLHYWSVGQHVAASAPVFGTGVLAYPERFRRQEMEMGGAHKDQANPHNEYLYVLASLGAVGLALYLAAHAAIMWHTRRLPAPSQRKVVHYYLLAALASILFNSMIVDMIPGHFHALAILTLAWFDWSTGAPGEGASA